MHHILIGGIALLAMAGYAFYEAHVDPTWRRLKLATGALIGIAGVALIVISFV